MCVVADVRKFDVWLSLMFRMNILFYCVKMVSHRPSLTRVLLYFLLPPAKNFFRVTFRSGGQLHTHSFQASDAFNKQQWLNCIRQAKVAVDSEPPRSPRSPSGFTAPSQVKMEERMDQSDSDSSDCSMDTSDAGAEASEVPTDCALMEHTDLVPTPVEVWQSYCNTDLC